MFVAWFMTISIFLICLYATVTIIYGLKEKDQYDLAHLHAQMNNIAKSDKEMIKQAI